MDVKITFLTDFDKAHGMKLGGVYEVVDIGDDFYVINLDGRRNLPKNVDIRFTLRRYPIGKFQAVEL